MVRCPPCLPARRVCRRAVWASGRVGEWRAYAQGVRGLTRGRGVVGYTVGGDAERLPLLLARARRYFGPSSARGRLPQEPPSGG